ncbi:MAG: hypothetical protein K9M45_04795, partial [Kiritimatiellales bacterium]|nr:hypothetical protein [Kiritimatiellales bacterium]
MKKLLMILGIVLVAGLVQGELITFEFGSAGASGLDLDELHIGTTTISGVVMTATAGSVVGDEFNQTATSFGINAAGTGDDTDQIDGGSMVDEFMTFYFDKPGTLVSIDFGSLITGDSDTGNVFSAAASLNLDFHNDNTDGSDVLTVGSNFLAGAANSFTISYKSGNGFALEGITIDAIPEPATIGLLGMACVGLFY